ncbi:hypothetical protein D5R40_19680 [Okeania hirsuta]|uniref:Uncharacterized protein n=1 Tax=Okeania hirsuta TaxID=1458930 RepID=A0A3N6RKJ1_9CYAN|nr:hypothetical protein [Okeania hirsuta]RQH35901.1 hypothetical protein D5R40_19680 [Okeania hirsuta]
MTEANQINDNLSQPQSESKSNDLAINEGINRTVDAIVDLAMNKVSDEQERQLVQSDIAGILRDSLYELVDSKAERPKPQPAFTEQSTFTTQPDFTTQDTSNIGNTAQAGIDVAKEVQNLGFVEFTAGLINGTFDAIIGSTIKQMQAYADLVANLAKTLKQFEAENVSQAQVTAHLIERYPDPNDNSQTVVRSDYTFTNQQLKEVAEALELETSNLDTPLSLTIAQNATQFNANQVKDIRKKLSESLAQSMLDHLREMAREGMARIVISDGEILSKLTFKVSSSEADRKAESRYVREQGGAYIRGRAGWGWGRVSVGGSYSKLDVKAVNESSFDSLTMSTEIIGQVKLRFRTETFAPVES